MSVPHTARFCEPLPDRKVLCTLCPHDCRIPDGACGICAVRYNVGGRLYTLVCDKVVARNLEPIEKKPLFHFHPGSTTYSSPTVGCCLRCAFCQNWQISQWPKHFSARTGPSPVLGLEAPTQNDKGGRSPLRASVLARRRP
jgi:pyruvate formate lyase activating enzyme